MHIHIYRRTLQMHAIAVAGSTVAYIHIPATCARCITAIAEAELIRRARIGSATRRRLTIANGKEASVQREVVGLWYISCVHVVDGWVVRGVLLMYRDGSDMGGFGVGRVGLKMVFLRQKFLKSSKFLFYVNCLNNYS